MPSLPLTHQHQALQHSYANSDCLPCHILGQANSRSALFNSANCLLQLRHGPDLITGPSSRFTLDTMISGIVRAAPAYSYGDCPMGLLCQDTYRVAKCTVWAQALYAAMHVSVPLKV